MEAVLPLNVTPSKVKNISSIVAELSPPAYPIIIGFEVKVEARV